LLKSLIFCFFLLLSAAAAERDIWSSRVPASHSSTAANASLPPLPRSTMRAWRVQNLMPASAPFCQMRGFTMSIILSPFSMVDHGTGSGGPLSTTSMTWSSSAE